MWCSSSVGKPSRAESSVCVLAGMVKCVEEGLSGVLTAMKMV